MIAAPSLLFSGVRALVFDLDGTLIDSRLDLANAVNGTLEHLGRPRLEPEVIFSYVGNGAPTLVRRALGENVTEEQAQGALSYFLQYYRAHMLDHTVPYPGVKPGLEELRAFPMAVLTNKPVIFSRAILTGLGISRYFRYVYGGNSFERKKPDPLGLNILLRDLSVGPQEAMFIGDSEVDVLTARNAGTFACGVTYGLGSARLAQFAPDLLIDTLLDLPKFLNSNDRK